MTPDRLALLIDGHFSGSLAPAERQQLDATLISSEEARSQFLLAAQLHVQLFLALNRDTVVTDEDDEAEMVSPRSKASALAEPKELTTRRTGWLPRLAHEFAWQPLSLVLLAAAAILGMVLAWQFSRTPSQPIAGKVSLPPDNETKPMIARVGRTVQATWGPSDATRGVKSDAQLREGMKLAGGDQLVLREGLAEIVFDTGVVMILEGPAEFVVGGQRAKLHGESDLHRNSGFLTAGKLVATVPPQAKGFTIQTPGARIVDLGTEFGVLVKRLPAAVELSRDAYSTEVHVFQGHVNLEPHVGTSPKSGQAPTPGLIELQAGEGAVCSPAVEPRITKEMSSAFVRTLPTALARLDSLSWTWPGSLKPGDIVAAAVDDLKLMKIDPNTGAQTLLATGLRKVHGDWGSVTIDRRGNILVGAHGLPKVGLGVLRINPRDGAVAVLASGSTLLADAAKSISTIVESANGDIYVAIHSDAGDQVMRIDPVSGAASKVAALNDAVAMHVDVNGRDVFVISRTGTVALVRNGAVIERVVDRQRVGTPLDIAAALDGRLFVASTQQGVRKILEVSRDAAQAVTTVATLPSTDRAGGRWNIALEPNGNLLVSPWNHDARVLRVNPGSGQVSVVSTGGLLTGEVIVNVVPQIRSQP